MCFEIALLYFIINILYAFITRGSSVMILNQGAGSHYLRWSAW